MGNGINILLLHLFPVFHRITLVENCRKGICSRSVGQCWVDGECHELINLLIDILC